MKRRNKKRERKISFTQQLLLDMLLNVGELYEIGMKTYRGPFAPPREIKGDKFSKKKCQSYSQLKRRKRIKVIKEGEQQFYQLTSKGYQEALKSRIITKNEKLPEGSFCLVIFDIPEDIRKVRWAFRNLLKKADFNQVQRSVWESDREVVDEIRALARELKLDKYIMVYRALGER